MDIKNINGKIIITLSPDDLNGMIDPKDLGDYSKISIRIAKRTGRPCQTEEHKQMVKKECARRYAEDNKERRKIKRQENKIKIAAGTYERRPKGRPKLSEEEKLQRKAERDAKKQLQQTPDQNPINLV